MFIERIVDAVKLLHSPDVLPSDPSTAIARLGSIIDNLDETDPRSVILAQEADRLANSVLPTTDQS